VVLHPHGGSQLRDVPLNLELKLEVWDSPNSAGVIIDAVRCAKLALDPRPRWAPARPERVFHEVARQCSIATRKAREMVETFAQD